MRILYVLHQFYPQFHSGTEQFVLALARAGRARGDDVRVFTVDPDFRQEERHAELREFDVHGVPVTRYRFDRDQLHNWVLQEYRNPEVGGSFCALLDDFRPDAVHLFHLRWVGVDRLEEVQARGIKAFVHLMDFWFACPNFLLLRADGELCDGPPDDGLGCLDCVHTWMADAGRSDAARAQFAELEASGAAPVNEPSPEAGAYAMMHRPRVLAEALGRADHVFAPSRTVRDVLAGAGAISDRVTLMPYPVDWDVLDGVAAPAADAPITIGFLGTFAPHKGVDILVDAFRGLPDADVRLRVHGRFGDFPEFDDELRTLAADDPRIEFPGSFERAELRDVLAGLHATVVPSRWRENTPFVCLEARAAGLPVIASDLSGMAEAVPEGRGRLFKTGDAADLRRVLGEVADDIRSGRWLRAADRTIPSVPDHYETLRGFYAGGA